MTTLRRRIGRFQGSSEVSNRSIAVNASIVAAAFVASKLLGMAREILIARQFGTGTNYGAYVAAFRIPDLLFLVVMSGAFGSAFIPVFGGYLGRGELDRAWRLASAVMTYTVLVLLAFGILAFIFAKPLIHYIVAPGYSPAETALSAHLTRLLLLSPLLLGVGAASQGMLQAFDSFALPALAPILYNLGIIFGAVVLAPHYGIYGLVYGVLIGATAHAGIQLIGLLFKGMHLRPRISRATEGLREVGRLMGPRIIGQMAYQINIVVMTRFASDLGASKVSALNYANQLFMLPHGVLAISLSTVIFPLMARQFELHQIDDLKRTLHRALGPLLFLTFPAGIGLLVFRLSIVQTIFQFGAFSSRSTDLVASALAYFSVGLIAFAVVEAVTRAYYAMHDTRTPVYAALVTIVANIILSALLSPVLGERGLALSISITTTIEMTILLVVLYRRLGGFGMQLFDSIFKTVLASGVMLFVALIFATPLEKATNPAHGRSIESLLAFVLTLGAVGATYLVTAWYIRSPDLHDGLARVQRQIARFR